MNRSAITTAVAIVTAFSVGLTWSYFTNSRTGGVAVVDLDEVAKRLGRDKEMTDSLQAQTGELQEALAKIQSNATQQLEKVRASLGQEVTNEEAQQFVRLRNKAQLTLNELQQQARVRIGQSRQQLISEFRQQTQPVAAKIAKEKGFDTVVTRNDTVVFSYDNSVDITDDVVKLMSAEFPASAKPLKPASQKQAAATPQTETNTESATATAATENTESATE
ncbi:Outer membrane protein (OmpH-like) [Thalassoglobus neptunius]|uniref:Outer membrane protein (OmpH-like) n=1 Tax=Thalassoglobus neptunius TaxID=1938619 RepID=A0A5C5X4E3_9PLAN|nr:OmpH family outer membrane protein [Thalassoglobus neptunius]TWT57002.1 Outer membrane protein (OmpH-like) [Thalassoglobus neptunius]